MFNRWIIGYSIFLIVFSVACYVWYRQDIASYKQEAAKTAVIARQWEIEKPKSRSTAEIVSPQAPADSTPQTAEKPIPPAEVGNNTKAEGQQQSKTPVETAAAKDVPVSPHGFGPYPEVPADFPGGKRYWHLYTDPDYELLDRVWIKLWQQGIKVEGMTTKRNGLFYPIIKGVCYVEWDVREYPDGTTERYVSRSTGHPDDDLGGEDGPVFENDIPGHLTIYTYPDGGIDPYQFLDLPKE